MTTRFPLAVYLMVEMYTCWCGEFASMLFISLQISTGLGLRASADCVCARSRITLAFLGLVLATAEYVGTLLLRGCTSPLGGFALLEWVALAF